MALEKSVINVGENGTVKYAPGDDAINVFTVLLSDLAAGKGPVGLAFRHAAFLTDACLLLKQKTGNFEFFTMAQQFAIIDELSVFRNRRLVNLFNGKDARKMLVEFQHIALGTAEAIEMGLDELVDFMDGVETQFKLMQKAASLCVDYRPYLSTVNDDADVDGFKNPWCTNVQDKVVETGDLISITIDAADAVHVLLIERKFSPGINQLALPGGFKDASDILDEQTCKREFAEETGFETTGMVTSYHRLNDLVSNNHDPRPRFSKHGTCAHAILRVDIFI